MVFKQGGRAGAHASRPGFLILSGKLVWMLVYVPPRLLQNIHMKLRSLYKKVRGQSEAALQIVCVAKTLISVEAKKLLIKNLFHYLNETQ